MIEAGGEPGEAGVDRVPRVAIACQGGGSHAAFGAGVLHRLLEDHGRCYRLAAISGTSGGAVNAALVWAGLIQGGPAEAQARLEGLWSDLEARAPADMARNWWGQVVANLPYTWEVSPYAIDLGARAEMEGHLRKWVRLEEMPAEPERLNDPILYVGATDILNGAAVAIRGDGKALMPPHRGLQLQHTPFDYADVIASIAIPPLFKDVAHRGTAFWDGLFSINPPVHVLTKLDPRPDEIWVIRINPKQIETAPTAMADIDDRRNELAGNLALGKELAMIEMVNRMLASGHLQGGPYRRITVRSVGIEETDTGLPLASKFDRSPALLRRLFELGRSRAEAFYREDDAEPKAARLAAGAFG